MDKWLVNRIGLKVVVVLLLVDDLLSSSMEKFVCDEGEGDVLREEEPDGEGLGTVGTSSVGEWKQCLLFCRLLQNHTLTSSGSRSNS